ncbi:unnamed protein product [Sphenostylis stenocarpa]|uniref:Uncharacterized protein n=1 Tax=Sphenostylis stenocarpa TaxID=92480 RepID=A0AA86SSU9_9FABA|nr:unnamed protein product [Sphenostylis stenocarpa]
MPFWYVVGGARCRWNGGPKYLVGLCECKSIGFGHRGGIESKRQGPNLADRGKEGHSPLTIPRRVFKSSAKDSTRRPMEIALKASRKADPPHEGHPRTCLRGPRPPPLVGKRTTAHAAASSPDSDLEAFSS